MAIIVWNKCFCTLWKQQQQQNTNTYLHDNFSFLIMSFCITAFLSIWNKIFTEYKIRSLKHNYVDGTDFIGGIIQFSCCDQDRWLTTAFNQYPSFIIERLSRICDNSFMVDCLCLNKWPVWFFTFRQQVKPHWLVLLDMKMI